MDHYVTSHLAESDNPSIAFDPATDVLHFDHAGTLPTDVIPGDQSVDGIFTTFLVIDTGPQAGHTITLTGDISAPQLTTTNLVFASGGVWVMGDNTTSRAADNAGNTLNGTGFADAFAGMGGNDLVLAGAGDDFIWQSNNGPLGADTIKGGAGIDGVSYDEAIAPIVAHLGTGSVTGGMDALDTAQLTGIENFFGGVAGDNITGSATANVLAGNGGNDTVRGGGGNDTVVGNAGHDRLAGGAGADKFVFDAQPKAANSDVITDFTLGSDKIWLDNAAGLFAAAGPNGVLQEAKYYEAAGASAAQDASDRLIYDTASGKLYYDADGTGTSKLPVLVATLAGAPDIDYTDIRVI